ncbi:alpha/beta-hydrolase, partial [Aureobasidium subglaciale]
HDGILSSKFIRFWWDGQVLSNQYSKGGRAARNWGPDSIEGDLSEDELRANRQDQNEDNTNNHFRDDPYYASKEYNMADIQVPLLSVANWCGIHLHLRGNVEGWVSAGSELKYLSFITGRHDLPFYYKEEVEVQRSFLDAFPKGGDRGGWSDVTAPNVDLVLRKGDVGFNNPEDEKTFPRHIETEWPLAHTQYIPYYLTPDLILTTLQPENTVKSQLGYKALGFMDPWINLKCFNSRPQPSSKRLRSRAISPRILTHFSAEGKEIFYTGTGGNNVPLCKGWLRVCLRKINSDHARHRFYLPYRDYFSSDVLPVIPGEIHPVVVEVWPTNIIFEKGERLVLDVASGDTQSCEKFQHNSPIDRTPEKLMGRNFIHISSERPNFVTLPVIPPK